MPTSFFLTRRGLGHPIPAGFDSQGKLLHTLGCSYSHKAGTLPGTKVQLPWRSLWRSLWPRPTGLASSLAGAPSTGGFLGPIPRLTDEVESSLVRFVASDQRSVLGVSTLRFPRPLGWDVDSSFYHTSASVLRAPCQNGHT